MQNKGREHEKKGRVRTYKLRQEELMDKYPKSATQIENWNSGRTINRRAMATIWNKFYRSHERKEEERTMK